MPEDLFTLYPRAHRIELACVARDKQSLVRSICLVGCTLCRKCVGKCPAGADTWVGRATLIDHEKCLDYGPSCGEVCVDVCPAKNKSEVRLKALNMVPQLPIREQERANWDFFLAYTQRVVLFVFLLNAFALATGRAAPHNGRRFPRERSARGYRGPDTRRGPAWVAWRVPRVHGDNARLGARRPRNERSVFRCVVRFLTSSASPNEHPP